MVVTWCLHGGYMVVTWWLHGGYMVVTWWLHGGYTHLVHPAPGVGGVPGRDPGRIEGGLLRLVHCAVGSLVRPYVVRYGAYMVVT